MKYNETMQLHLPERNVTHLFLFLVSASGLGWFINSFPPETLWQFAAFYLLLGSSLFFLFHFILVHTRRAFLISLSTIIFLLLRALNLRHPLYLVFLVICLLSIEYSIGRQKRVK